MIMYKIDWNSFKIKNENPTKAFEDLGYHLFCRKHKFPEGIQADFNQAGLETYPQKSNIDGSRVGFQSKFFEEGIDYNQIKKSIQKAIDKFEDKLDEITIFLNVSAKLSSKSAQQIETLASNKNIKINWFTLSQFEIALNQPSNLDLAQLYFGIGDEFGFIRSNLTTEDLDFLQSSQFIDLPILDLVKNKRGSIELSEKITLITGNPGSGKSILVKHLFFTFSKIGETMSIFENNASLPMLINLKDCYSDSLENLIRHRQNDYKVRYNKIKFIYLLDGLDELNEIQAEITLRYIKQLSNLNNTQNIIISCRKGNLNKLMVMEYFNLVKNYEIEQLSIEDTENYFHQKSDISKIEELSILKQANLKLVQEITDIFLVKLLWDTIENLNKNSTIINLLEFKIRTLLRTNDHKSILSTLNLLNPKEDRIIMLNEIISYKFSKKFQFRFEHSALAKVLQKELKNIDYESINKILHYNSSTFFDTSLDNEFLNASYIYQHRRYQEYFFARRLKKRFEKKTNIIRTDGIILNADFFDEIFMKYLENEYRKTHDIASLILLRSIKFYQSNADQWYISDSDYFINNLSYQTDKTLEVLSNDDILNTKKYITVSYRNALEFYKNNKHSFAQELVNEIPKNSWTIKELEGFLFYIFKIQKTDSYVDFFIKKYRKYYNKFDNESSVTLNDQSQQEFAIKAYFSVGLNSSLPELLNLLPLLEDSEFIFFLDLLSNNEFLPIFFHSAEIKKIIFNRFKGFRKKVSLKNLPVYFFKKLLNLSTTEHQISQIISVILPVGDRINPYFFNRFIHHFALVNVIIEEERFIKEISFHNHKTVDDVRKFSFLFNIYVKTLRDGDSFAKALIQFYNKFKNYYPSTTNPKKEFSKLWAHIFFNSNAQRTQYLQINKKLVKDFDSVIFLENLNKINQSYFSNTIFESDLVPFESELKVWKNDFPQLIDRCFILSGMFSQINPKKAVHYIKEGFVNSKLRHGWRKDTIVSEFLNDSFRQILDKNWFSKKEVKNLSKSLYNLNIRLYEVTDRDHTKYGISKFLEALSRFDTKLAYSYLKKFKKLDLNWYVSNISLTEILINDIRNNAVNYDIIEKKVNTFQRHYNYDNKIDGSYYDQTFIIWI